MRYLISTIRVIASIIYLLAGFVALIMALMYLWGAIAGVAPFAPFAHGGIPLPSFVVVMWTLPLLLAVVGCDIYFRLTKRYRLE